MKSPSEDVVIHNESYTISTGLKEQERQVRTDTLTHKPELQIIHQCSDDFEIY